MSTDLPLSGVCVVELGDSASAPFAGQALAALGAQVWKVERPDTGDSSRSWGPSKWKGSGASYHALNRGKKSICLDIKVPEQLARLRRLIDEHADVFISNLRPGSAAGYGLDGESLRAHNPALIVSEVGAFGHTGPMRHQPGYDPLMQAFAGIMSVTGEEGRPPVRAGVSIIDFGTGIWAVVGILAALYRRTHTHQGALVNNSLLETAISWMTVSIGNYAADGEPGGRFGSGVAFIVPHRAFTTADGYLVVSCANDRLFARLCEALDRPQWAVDPKFATNEARIKNRDEINNLIEERLAEEPREFWQRRLDAHGIPSAPIQSTAEIYHHEQTRALGIIGKPGEDEIGLVGLPLSFDGVRPAPLHAAPDIGQDDADLDRLLRSGPHQD